MNEMISVIVPFYNAEKYINRCIESIVNQKYSNLEIILVDDGSDDNSADFCDRWAERDNRIRVIHTENSGVFAARKTGIMASHGRYIAFIDSDDWIDTEMFDCLYKLMTSGDFQISCCSYQLVKDGGQPQKESSPEIIKQYGFSDIIKNLYNDAMWSLCTKLYDRVLFENIDNINSNLSVSEDLLLNYHLYKRCKTAVLTDKKLYFYFRHSDSVMGKSLNIKRIKDSMTAYQLIENDMDKSSKAYSYHIANMISNDFGFLMQIVKQNTCFECYDEIRKEIIKYKKFIFKKENSGTLSINHKIGVILLIFSPKLFNLTLKMK